MKILNSLIIGLVISLAACQDNELVQKDKPLTASTLTDDGQPTGPGTNSLRIYILDVRFSRTTCSTGPGVCFKDGSGDIWDYNFYELPSSGGDVGPIGVEFEGEKLRLSFFRSLEEDSLIIEEDVKLNDKIADALGRNIIVLKAGTYRVTYDNYKFGEASVDVASK